MSQTKADKSTSLDWEWMDWRNWAEGLMGDHDPGQVADSIADLGQQLNDLRKGMAAEAIIVKAQVFSMNPRAVGKGRSGIVRAQVRRMLRAALAQELPRTIVQWGRSWPEQATRELERFEDECART